ncbi:hypothetical protein [African swine fever virus]|uniref:Uncharacterized protein n=1 Tax=African swine fever virus TaxID=10497 RepID=A0A3G1EVA9_ASF|nr:hypothetical protein F8221_gp198 [African swine fever virus]AOO54502.1 hypothetical protein AFSV47Ss_0197 [African swine fever virus]QIM06839.1 hypothetical protein [African swine fever virus]QIM07074.1 hypothetical protein [African swine fever virus]QIM07309.1 hypothetical protein [African swine fever virus]QIM07544.1 hypothetical protein [African swine fever virus]
MLWVNCEYREVDVVGLGMGSKSSKPAAKLGIIVSEFSSYSREPIEVRSLESSFKYWIGELKSAITITIPFFFTFN